MFVLEFYLYVWLNWNLHVTHTSCVALKFGFAHLESESDFRHFVDFVHLAHASQTLCSAQILTNGRAFCSKFPPSMQAIGLFLLNSNLAKPCVKVVHAF